jgi:uncharacterized protein YidB (DUF937 family)
MGLLDGLLGGLLGGGGGGAGLPGMGGLGGLGGASGGQNPLLQIALQMLQQNGGLQGMLGKFQQAGYGDHAASWVSTGQNLPIDPSAISEVLGSGQLADIAQKLGMSGNQAAGGLASMLPQLIDQMTPKGQVETGSDDVVAQALQMLQKSRKA